VSLQQGMPAGAGCVFRESFDNTISVMDNSGVIVASSVDRGISPLGLSARVTYDQTRTLLINATKMTLALRFRTGAELVPPGTPYRVVAGKCTAAGYANNQFLCMIDHASAGASPHIYLYVGPGTANSTLITAALSVSTEYTVHAVFDGDLAAALRVKWFLQGQSVVISNNGSMPAVMAGTPTPLCALNLDGGSTSAPPNDFILRSVGVFNFAMSPEECLDDYQQDMAQEVTPQ
jgi:hypothetical protein